MLINLRNALMTGKRLPYDAEVEYLESTGTQYIAMGIAGNTLSRIDIGIEKTEANGTRRFVVGSNRDPNASIGSSTYFDVNTSGYFGQNSNGFACTVGQWYNLSIRADGYYSDGVKVYSPYFVFPLRPSVELCLLSVGTATSGRWVGRVSYLKAWDTNGNLVQDCIAVRKSGVGYLYDRVSGKLFGNAGTGDFVLGPDVVPVEWLEGGQLDSGIAFIDTGYSPNSSTKIESTSAILSANGYSGRFGNQSRLAFGIGSGRLYLAQGGHYFLGSYTVGAFYSFVNDIANHTVSVEGVGSTSTTAVSDWYSQLYPVYLFASNTAPVSGTVVNGKHLDPNSLGQIRMKSCGIWENNTPVRKFLPVRVGTGSTWEGALIDTLTRRIYRNAGTGAFSYGNDLKYPIPAE